LCGHEGINSVTLKGCLRANGEVVKEKKNSSLLSEVLKQRETEPKQSGQKDNDVEIEMNNKLLPRDSSAIPYAQVAKVATSLDGLP
jgi:hypothetical protein